MTFYRALLTAALLAAPLTAHAIDDTDRHFLMEESSGGAYEIALASLAQQRTSREDVRSYASRVIADHATYNEALAQLGQAKGVELPTEMTREDRVRLNSINGQAGSTADASFIEEATRINADDKKTAAEELARTADSEIRAFLTKFAAMDAEHERMALALKK